MASVITTTQSDLMPQLMRLFHAADLVSEEDWKAYGEANEKHKPILDVLTQPVSLDSFKNLLNAEITFKTSKTKKESDLHRELSFTSFINDQELTGLLDNFGRPVPELLAPLHRDGMLSEDQVRQLKESATSGSAALIGWGGIQSEMTHQWLGSLKSSAMREGALYLALYLLRENELLPISEFNRLLTELESGDRRSVHGQLAGAHQLTSERLVAEIENGLKLPQIRLETIKLNPALIAIFPQSFIRRQTFLPLGRTTRFLAIATADPFNITQVAFLRWVTGLWAEPAFSSARGLIDTINSFYAGEYEQENAKKGDGEEKQQHLDDSESAKLRGAVASAALADEAAIAVPLPPGAPGKPASGGAVRKSQATKSGAPSSLAAKKAAQGEMRKRFDGEMITDNVSAVQLVSSLIESAIEMRTTDIHIEPAREGLIVRFRIDGELHRILAVPPGLAQPVVSRIKVLAEMDVTERRRPQDGHFELKLENHNFDFRISTLPAVLGEKIVIRILDTAQIKSSMQDLGLLPKQRQLVDWMLERQHGMILVTGPTGSGKTSTLYAALNKLNHEKRNLVTIEDPVEYQLSGINQVQVNTDIGLTFSEGLRSILRQDPDVIMVGEIRDADTARNAIRAATTGHLMLSTLHTNSALGSVDAMVQLGTAPFILAHSLTGIIAQRLVRKLCVHCRKAYTMKPDAALQLGLENGAPKKRIYRATGCAECMGSGYHGRTGAFEVVRIVEAVRALIAGHQRLEVLERTCREQGMSSLQEAGVEKVLAGETSVEEVMQKITMDI